MTTFLDAAIFMYAGGGPHPLKDPCLAIISRVRARTLDATTSAEVVQEILHRYISIRRAEVGLAIARDVLKAFRPVLPITDGVARRLPDLAERYPSLASRDLVHVATCVEVGIDTIISPDRGFDLVQEVRRVDPVVAAA
jgi:predicted nucleic acid-binding protein